MKKSCLFLLIAGIVIIVYLLPLTGRPLITPDETRYAEIPREMLVSGNFISPHLNGVRYFEKPPLYYWCTAVSFKLFGENRFALRLPGMLAMLGTAWIVFLLMSQYYERKTALLGAWIYVTLPMCFLLASIALTDFVLTFLLTAALAAYFRAIQSGISQGKKMGLLFLCGIFCGLAFMTKGFVSLAVPVIVVIPYLLWEKRWKDLFTTPLLPILGAVLIVAPWGLAIHHQEPDFWRYFVIEEHINRFFGGTAAQHPKSVFYFIPVLLIGMIPWVLMIPNMFKSLRNKISASPLLKFSLCGLIMPFLLFSCSSGKLPTYILPCFAFAAMLITVAVDDFLLREQRIRAFHLSLLLLTITAWICGIAILINLFTAVPEPVFIKADMAQIALIWIAVLGVTGIFLIAWKAIPARKPAFFLCGLMLVAMISNFIFPVTVQEYKAPSEFFAEVRKSLPEKTVILSYCRVFQSVCWGFRRSDVYMFFSEGEITYGLSFPDAKERQINDPKVFKNKFDTWRKNGIPVAIVIDTYKCNPFLKVLGKPVWMKKSYPGTDDGFIVALY